MSSTSRLLPMVRMASRALLGSLLFGLTLAVPVSAAEAPVAVPAPAYDVPKAAGPMQTAVLSGGCFWGVQGVFEHLVGVRQVLSGYAGGAKSNAIYEVVSGGNTGHAESVQINYDPLKVSYGQILQVYFSVAHNPTELNRQGPDVGTQYRSAIFYANDAQKKVAETYIAQLSKSGVFGAPIVTQLAPLQGFYPAEGYHQDYLLMNPTSPYIVYNDLPKIRNFQKLLPVLYQAKAVTVTELKQ
jgi:peptide-methionine (S)-S-oxide reductase